MCVLGEGKQLAGRGRSGVAGGGGGQTVPRRENLEQFPMTESSAWASVINSYSLTWTVLTGEASYRGGGTAHLPMAPLSVHGMT